VFTLAPQQLVGANAAVDIPNVAGQTFKVGGQKLVDMHLKVAQVDQPSDTVPIDQIIATDPVAGTRVTPGYTVQVTVSTGPVQVTLPGQIYKPEADAKTAIAAAGLKYGATTTDYSPSVPAGQVIGVLVPGSTTPNGGNVQVTKGATVNLVVSNGLVQMPDVSGQAAAAARDLLSGSTYALTVKLTPTTSCSGQKVTGQSPGPGDVPQRSTVTLTYCNG
jgi:eukaryotic-like serine/threonine-protein kinase